MDCLNVLLCEEKFVSFIEKISTPVFPVKKAMKIEKNEKGNNVFFLFLG